MSIQSEINRITGFRNSSLSAVSDKGVVVPNGSAIDDLPELIQRIPAYSAVSGYDPANGTITISSIAVKLGDLSWTYNSNYSRFQSTTLQDIIDKPSAQATALAGLFCQNYTTVAASSVTATDKSIGVATSGVLMIRDSDYTQATAFKNAMGDVTIVLPLATPSSGGGGGEMVTISFDRMSAIFNSFYAPASSTFEEDEEDPAILHITAPANSIICSNIGFQLSPRMLILTGVTASFVGSGSEGYYVFYLGNTDGHVQC